ncbi:MAG: transcription-repair coupling factor (superfamily II helicase) [Cryomorphaceae bacterium]|jgi:transcription-repair coupling factor (superfamily II helicase)
MAPLCLADTDRHSGLSFIIAAAAHQHGGKFAKSRVWFLSDQPRLNQALTAELDFWNINSQILLEKNTDSATTELDDPEANADRLHTLSKIASESGELIITSSFDSPCPAPCAISLHDSSLTTGSEQDPDLLIKSLEKAGFERVDHIHNRGQYALRGGILDIYTWQAPYPVRVEFFDTEIDSIREFDLNTQTSIRKINQAQLHLTEPEETATVADYIGENDLIITLNVEELSKLFTHHLRITSDPLAEISIHPSPLGAFEAGDFVLQQNKRHAFTKQLAEWNTDGWDIHLIFSNKGEIERFTELMGDSILNGIETSIGELAHGFTIPSAKLTIISSAELFGRYQTSNNRKNTHLEHQRRARGQADILDIEKGDLVVHTEYGIGRFQDITTDSDGTEEINIRYRDKAILSVPIDQAHLLAKYVGMGGKTPVLSKLGDAKWSRARKSAEKSILDYAAQLLRLQAERQVEKGIGHPPDTKWMWEFENSFRYTETPDQLTAIEDAKADMECPKPMDRLICGDVGFGKTEVAIRAAFKAVTGGKQAAILVPTTVLAEQHWRTFRERMSDYPIRVELLNRFRKPAEIRSTIKGLADGSVDIVIGTHRLVSNDIKFHDLGVAIVDEEQRFGVKHKEKFKELFAGIDLLTLSATPIPRTLYLSLMGTRDMSTIDTAPPNKVPVQTSICGYDERIIRTAITREMDRGGQIFFLHNRVKTIEVMRDKIHALIPDAKIVIGHGQMEKDELEDVMRTFVKGAADILLATTIIESGIDIPNANTIIIDRADRFGLADLYQLRGRVGRGAQQAYAILLIPRDLTVGGDATKRINAIKQYTALGSGFKIAMRDLEIRGAGNLLGTKQSGHISSVGFDLYCQLLRQSIERLKGNINAIRIDVTLRADFLNFTETAAAQPQSLTNHKSQITYLDCYIPAAYMTEPTMRIRAYKQLAEAATEKVINQLKENWQDQYGKLPVPAQNLLQTTLLKISAAHANITSIEIKSQRLMLTRNNQYIMLSQTRFPRLTATNPRKKLAEANSMLKSI